MTSQKITMKMQHLMKKSDPILLFEEVFFPLTNGDFLQ